ncbi:hypothetical protein AAFF_G00092610 [Aldrovandia affinis]|uniref:Uncharacterized protein n=1 Tax=Aldrovandia affinis TaxID=143900 RepID=A0AAD7WY29_9TELE|nr:hypothetical protein AAFF_G00092610 [Aldrovandia affinis]
MPGLIGPSQQGAELSTDRARESEGKIATCFCQEDYLFCQVMQSVKGSVCFLCLVDVVPVKNEDGMVIMFILNFEVMTDNELRDPNQNLNHKLTLPWLSGRSRGFKLRLPLLRSLSNSKHSLQEDPETGRARDPSHPSHESLVLGELLSLPEQPRPALLWPEDQRTLLLDSEPPLSLSLPLPLTQSSPHPHPYRLNPEASVSNCSLTHSRSRDSFHSMRRASSVDDIEAMRPEWDRKFRTRPGSTGAVNNKSNILNSTSDSDLMRYRTISKIPQITLNFVDFKPDPLITLPAGEMDIIAPCKLIDRTHHVTEKVTQWRAIKANAAGKDEDKTVIPGCLSLSLMCTVLWASASGDVVKIAVMEMHLVLELSGVKFTYRTGDVATDGGAVERHQLRP